MEDENSGNSHKEIVMRQFNKLCTLSNVEFRGGFYTRAVDTLGKSSDVYVPDSREVFSNGIYTLALILEPDFDKEMKEQWQKFHNDLKVIQDNFMNKTEIKEEIILGDEYYTNIKEKVALETYKVKKMSLYLGLFLQISKQLNRLQYYDLVGGTFG